MTNLDEIGFVCVVISREDLDLFRFPLSGSYDSANPQTLIKKTHFGHLLA